MNIAQVVAHAERIVQRRIATTTLEDIELDRATSELTPQDQAQVLKVVHTRAAPRMVAATTAEKE